MFLIIMDLSLSKRKCFVSFVYIFTVKPHAGRRFGVERDSLMDP